MTNDPRELDPNEPDYLSEYAAALETSVAVLTRAARAFLEKWDECEPHVTGAFQIRQLHVGPYSGPNFASELEALRLAVENQEGCGE